MEVRSVFIVGAGLMGSGIAQVCAQSGMSVLLNDVSKETLKSALKTINWSVGKFIEKGKLVEDKNTIIGRIKTTTDYNTTESIDIIIEAVSEKIELKRQILKKVDRVCDPHTLIASNTSAIPITELATVTKHPEQVLGLHFFNPYR